MRSKLVEARVNKGFTQEKMAEKLGITRACYANYENGIREPSMKKVIQMKELLGTKSDHIFLNDDDTISVQ